MKRLILILIILSFVTSSGMALPWFTPKPKPTPSPVPVQIEQPKDVVSISNARTLIKELNGELTNIKFLNSNLQDNLKRANEKIASANDEIVKLNTAITNLTEWGVGWQSKAIVVQAELAKEKQDHEATKGRYHRAKIILAILAAAAGVFLGLQFMNLVPPPYNFLVPAGGAGLFAALVWFLL
jgi:hypothetical protein